MIEIMSAAFAAGEVKTFQIQGEYLEVLEAAFPVNVKLLTRSGGLLSEMRSAEASFFSRPGRFDTVTIESPAAQTVRWFLGSGDAGTRRAAGTVEVVDSSVNRTLAGQGFAVFGANNAAVGVYSYVALAAAAGKRLRLDSLHASVSNSVGLRSGIVPTATLTAAGAANYAYGASKLGGNPVSASAAMTVQTATDFLAGLGDQAVRYSYAASSPLDMSWQFRYPIVLPPGYALVMRASSQNCSLNAWLEFVEEVA